jgi:hypothetical protein
MGGEGSPAQSGVFAPLAGASIFRHGDPAPFADFRC